MLLFESLQENPFFIVVAQADNRKRALLLLRHMLQQRMQQQHQQELHAAAGAQMGSKDRSEKIRTYNFPSDCVRDHRFV